MGGGICHEKLSGDHGFFGQPVETASDPIRDRILYSDYQWIDTQIQMSRMHQMVMEEMPDKEGVFEAVYESRLRRLWHQ